MCGGPKIAVQFTFPPRHWPFEMTCLRSPAAMGQPASDPLIELGSLEKALVGFTEGQLRAWLRGRGEAGDVFAEP